MNGEKEMSYSNAPETKPSGPSLARRLIIGFIKFVLCVAILGGAVTGASYIVKSAPRPMKSTPVTLAPLVETQEIKRSDEKVVISAMGSVIPSRQIILKPEVSGEVIYVHPEFVDGGYLKAGEEILKLDPTEYELAILQQKSQIANTEYLMEVEMGYQEVARHEWDLLNQEEGKEISEKDAELALRKPHLEKARADLESARADLQKAELDLARTTVTAPFNAVVLSKNIDMGSQISQQEQLAELAGTDEYWIRVSLPMDRLNWLDIPPKVGGKGSEVGICTDNSTESGYACTGRVIKLLPDMETSSRMARILVSVEDPLGLNQPKSNRPVLLLGQYVRVDIQGHELKNVIKIPRTALRDNSSLWLLGEDKKLEIVEADIVWRNEDHVLLQNGLKQGAMLIVSDLQTPVAGMQLRLPGDEIQEVQAGEQGQDASGFPGGGMPGMPGGDLMASDKDNDGKVSKDEFEGPPMFFDMMDADKDGFITKTESESMQGPPGGKGGPPGGGFFPGRKG